MPRRLPKLRIPVPIDTSPEEVARVTLNTPAPERWKYMERRAKQVARRKTELGS